MAKVRTRKRGKTFSYIFEAGRTAAGKRKVIEKGGFPSKEAAYEAGIQAFTDFKHGGIGVKKDRPTFAAFSDVWLSHMQSEVREGTVHGYRVAVRNHLLPILGDMEMQDIRPAHIEKLMLSLRDEGLSKGTLTLIHGVASQIFKYAIYPAELIESNPVSYIKVPRAPMHIVKRTIITPELFHGLLDAFSDFPGMYTITSILYYTGMRIGEALGLVWEDIDFEQKALHIQRQCKIDTRNGKAVFTSLKTPQSNRIVYLNKELLKILQAEKERQEGLNIVNALDENSSCRSFSYGLSVKEKMTVVHPVCVGRNGSFLNRYTVTWLFQRHGINSHSFRHTQATMLADAGVSPRAVAGRLGHSSIRTTLGLYTHNTLKQQQKIAEIIDWKAGNDADKNRNADK